MVSPTPPESPPDAVEPVLIHDQAHGPGGPFPVVGVGASAGGLEAFTQLLSHLPGDSGMAFVLIQHLDPKHESRLVDILGKSTPLPVVEATQALEV